MRRADSSEAAPGSAILPVAMAEISLPRGRRRSPKAGGFALKTAAHCRSDEQREAVKDKCRAIGYQREPENCAHATLSDFVSV